MRKSVTIVVLLLCIMSSPVVEAGVGRSTSWNNAWMFGGGALAFSGAVVLVMGGPVVLGGVMAVSGLLAAGGAVYDEFVADKPVESPFLSDIKSEGWDEVNETIRRQLDQDERIERRIEGGRRFRQNLNNIGRWFRDLFGVKSARAGELEPLQPMGQFVKENAAGKKKGRRGKKTPKEKSRQNKNHAKKSDVVPQAVAPLGPIAAAAGAVAGAVGGAMAANNIYETRRHDYGIHSDNNAKMSFPVVNCQAGGDMFVKNLEGLPTVVPVEKYTQPGEKTAQLGGCRDEADCSKELTREICACADPETFFAGVVMVRIIKSKKPSAQYYCRKCGGFRRGNMFDVIRTNNGIVTYPAGVLPSDWDGKILTISELDARVKRLIDNSSDKLPKADVEENKQKDSQQGGVYVTDKGLKTDNSRAGVRGWCHCWDKEPPPMGGLVKGGIGSVGDGNLFADMFKFYDIEQTCDGDYSYTLCARCGKCFTTKKPGEKHSDRGHDIIDAKMYHKWHKKAGSEIPQYQYEKLLGEARDSLLKIPDGGIVISGLCRCKYPDPVTVNIIGGESDEFYVCCFCGKVRLPDEAGNIPTGPTQWLILMGEDKPFPGFTKESKWCAK